MVLTWEVIRGAIEAYVFDTKTTGPARIPMIIPYGGMLIGLFLFCLQICEHVFGLATAIVRSLRRAS